MLVQLHLSCPPNLKNVEAVNYTLNAVSNYGLNSGKMPSQWGKKNFLKNGSGGENEKNGKNYMARKV